ncbi:MAG: HD domain-containing phosphohydrolase [Clostridia bacterium]
MITDEQKKTIITLSTLVDVKEKSGHFNRVYLVTEMVAKEMSKKAEFKDVLNDDYIEILKYAAMLHDIGKISIADSILFKPARFTPEERELMKRHVIVDEEVIGCIAELLNSRELSSTLIEIIENHHENFDGSGYNKGIAGEEIPLSARIVAIADVYDALRSKRPYKEAYSHCKTMRIIEKDRCIKFFPEVVDALESSAAEITEMYLEKKICKLNSQYN